MMASFGSIINVVVIGCFCAYFLQVGFTMYEMFNPKQCDDKKNCLGPAISVEEQVMVCIAQNNFENDFKNNL